MRDMRARHDKTIGAECCLRVSAGAPIDRDAFADSIASTDRQPALITHETQILRIASYDGPFEYLVVRPEPAEPLDGDQAPQVAPIADRGILFDDRIRPYSQRMAENRALTDDCGWMNVHRSDRSISVRKTYAELLELTPESFSRIQGVQVGSIRLPVGYEAATVEDNNKDRVRGGLDPIFPNTSAGDDIGR